MSETWDTSAAFRPGSGRFGWSVCPGAVVTGRIDMQRHDAAGRDITGLSGLEDETDTVSMTGIEYEELQYEVEQLRQLRKYLDEPRVLLQIPQPHRMTISELLDGGR